MYRWMARIGLILAVLLLILAEPAVAGCKSDCKEKCPKDRIFGERPPRCMELCIEACKAKIPLPPDPPPPPLPPPLPEQVKPPAGIPNSRGPVPAWDDLPFTWSAGATPTASGSDIDKFFKRVEKAFCDLMTGGAYSRGDAGCHVQIGAGFDDEGDVHLENPETGEQFPEASTNGDKGTTVEDMISTLGTFDDYLSFEVPSYEEFASDGADSIARFLPGSYRLGDPLEGQEIAAPTALGVVRRTDGKGSGSFLARRSNEDGSFRYHGGIDYVTAPGDVIYAPVSGTVERIIQAIYKTDNQGLVGIVIRADSGHQVRLLYAQPNGNILPDSKVVAGKPIGTAQDLQWRFGEKMTNHVHIDIVDRRGRRVNPSGNMVISKEEKQ